MGPGKVTTTGSGWIKADKSGHWRAHSSLQLSAMGWGTAMLVLVGYTALCSICGHCGLGAASLHSCHGYHLLQSTLAPLTKMSCYDLCTPKTSVAVPQPIAESCNELCARQCPESSALIQPPPVVVTFPGPILTSFPQQAVVGSSGAPAFGGSLGLGGLYGAGATQASGGLCTFGRACAAPAYSPCALPRYSKKLWDTCGPC
ncbi:scale keratin-like [Catharus ustulatus]|uniref:scale keratin-like n=1 Tax=Catharus ustulatus TaxID=91951 RepID=UPI00140C8FA5|nr:scale keratin-like [Catharus ustulatus]